MSATKFGKSRSRRSTRAQRGQSLVEFALIFPVLAILFIGIADLARWYTSAIAVQASARDAADYGAFKAQSSWSASGTPSNISKTVEAMITRSCLGSTSTSDYVGDPPGTVMTCTNPTFACELQPPTGVVATPIECASYDGTTWGCADPTATPPQAPCRVKVTLTYTFHLFFGIPPMPQSITFSRDSTFALSNLRP